tara:strand:+ start:50 stop:190 length:141 start_codon:yes stop_codon:yes gene_type:complete
MYLFLRKQAGSFKKDISVPFSPIRLNGFLIYTRIFLQVLSTDILEK